MDLLCTTAPTTLSYSPSLTGGRSRASRFCLLLLGALTPGILPAETRSAQLFTIRLLGHHIQHITIISTWAMATVAPSAAHSITIKAAHRPVMIR